MTDQTAAFVPPAAENLPPGVLDSATDGASALDAWAREPAGRNFLAHALVQLARDGWLLVEPGEGFEVVRDRGTPEPTPAGQAPATDRAALRDRIRRAVCEAEGFAWDSDMLEPDEYGEVADMVLSVLPANTGLAEVAKQIDLRDYWHAEAMSATTRIIELEGQLEESRRAAVVPADRAAVLREAADAVAADTAFHIRYGSAIDYATRYADLLRRMADEAQQPEPQPRRGDAFEAWLKAQRDRYDRTDQREENSEFWHEFDSALDLYRLHADTGTPLGEHVCESRVVGDCECLEQPADEAQQPKEARS